MRWDWLSSLKNRLAKPGSRAATSSRRATPARSGRGIRRFESLESRALLSATVADDGVVIGHEGELAIDGPEPDYIPAFPEDGLTGPGGASTVAEAPFPLSETFNLHSRPSASHTIYLDFDGHVTTGTQWNTFYGSVVTPAYDFDGDTSSFSDPELERIQFIWERVVEDFSPFNVDVTTEAPSNTGDLTKSGPSDTRWGIRVAIGGSSSDWLGASAGGVAYIGSFNDSIDTPAYVFNRSEVGVAEAISHEVGHTLGLFHDGYPLDEYYPGHGSGSTG